MFKTTALALLAAAAFTAPAFAADLASVRVTLTGKSPAEIERDIHNAAAAVCADAGPSCVNEAVIEAHYQMASLNDHSPRVDPTGDGAYAVRVALKGKSADQLQTEIRSAA